MVEAAGARRASVSGLDGLDRPGLAQLTVVEGLARFVFRGDGAAEEAAGAAFGLAFPSAINRASQKGIRGAPGARAALRLGPDEILLLLRQSEGAAVLAALAAALIGQPHSLVEVTNRQIGLLLAGKGAAPVLNSGCPLDLSETAFPVGMATRTIFFKAEIVLWRLAPDQFRIEIWRSFAPYFADMLAEAARDFA